MDGYVFDSQINQWKRLERTLPTGFLGASCCSLSPTEIIFFGGYDKDTFNNFLSEISKIDVTKEPNKYKELITIFMSQPIDNYNWNKMFGHLHHAMNTGQLLVKTHLSLIVVLE